MSTGSTVASPPARVETPSSMASAVVQRQTSTSSSWSRILMLGRSASRVAPSDQSSHRVRSSCELKHRLSGRIGRNSRQDSHAQHQAAMALAVYGLKSAFWRSNSVQSDASHGRQLRRTRGNFRRGSGAIKHALEGQLGFGHQILTCGRPGPIPRIHAMRPPRAHLTGRGGGGRNTG